MKGKGVCVPVSQLDGNENIDFDTSTHTSTTAQPVPVIEQRFLHVRKTSEERGEKHRVLAARMRRAVTKKATKHRKAKKSNAKKRKNNVSTSTTSSTTTQSGPVIEEHVVPVSTNPYHISKSQDEIKKQRAFIARMRY